MRTVGVYDQIKRAFQDIVAPELHGLRGEIRVLDQRIMGLDQKIVAVDQKLDNVDARLSTKIDSLRGEMVSEIRRLDTRIDGLDARIGSLDRELRTAIDIRERLAALEARRSP
jgi:hypothetical protein